MAVNFSRKASGVHTCKVTDNRELVLSNASGGFGWSLVVRDASTRRIVARPATGLRTLAKGMEAADALVNSPQFSAFLLSIA